MNLPELRIPQRTTPGGPKAGRMLDADVLPWAGRRFEGAGPWEVAGEV